MINTLNVVIGAVGPLICVAVPPKKAAKKAIKAAPYNPAAAPKPDCYPKAKASGKATIPAVIPPNKSFLKYEKSNIFFMEYLV
jgi:hypothetical protein